MLDTPPIAGPRETGPYEGSGVGKNEARTEARGYKLAPVRTLRDHAGLWRQVARAARQGHDGAFCRPLLAITPVVRASALRLEERGGIDGATVADVQRRRPGAVILPLNAPRLATQAARQRAEMAAPWAAQPSRADQPIAFVRGGEPMGHECAVPLHACLMRFWNKQKKRSDHMVLVPSEQALSASWIVRHDEERPESEQD